jgi:hypothetical protein
MSSCEIAVNPERGAIDSSLQNQSNEESMLRPTFMRLMEEKNERLLREIEDSEPYQTIMRPEATHCDITTILKYILLEVFSYGPHLAGATRLAISRLKQLHPELVKRMFFNDLEKVDRGHLALKDFVQLGGNEQWARARQMTPESQKLAATCHSLAAQESPFACLGYLYLIEALTPVIISRLQVVLAVKGFPAGARHFIDSHATEDIADAKAIHGLINRVVRDIRATAPTIEYGFDRVAAVYPLPIWQAALRHARTELDKGTRWPEQSGQIHNNSGA